MNRIIWAIDVYPDRQVALEGIGRLLAALSAGGGVRIDPVYVLNPGQMQLSMGHPVRDPESEAREAMAGQIRPLGIQGLAAPTVLVEQDPTLNRAVDRLIEHARRMEADAIAVGTHGWTGIRRLLMGSFAESVLTRSHLPVLTLNPSARAPGRIRTILCPTDFTAASRIVFEEAVDLAGRQGAFLRLYHRTESPVEPVFQSGVRLLGGNWVPVEPYFNEEVERSREEAEAWIRRAKGRGVSADLILEETTGSFAEGIIGTARSTDADLITLASGRGPAAAALIGSVAKQVVRSAPCAVWVIHPSPTEGVRAA